MAGIDLRLSLLLLAFPTLILVHLLLAPYTKVEESFNIQATHDILAHGIPAPFSPGASRKLAASYDHFAFPGAVPRTFVGAVLLAGLGRPFVALAGRPQLVVRALLGLANAAALAYFGLSVERAFGRAAAAWYVALQASQFHVIFYASRTLPNMFAFGMTTLASAFLLPVVTSRRSPAARHRLAISLLVFAGIIFRSEVALLLATQTSYLLFATRARPAAAWPRLASAFALSCAVALVLSVPLDTYLWQAPPVLWPELWAFYYNAVRGAASDWGVSPWHFYFSSALPRLLLNPLSYLLLVPLALGSPARARAARQLVVPNLLFVAVYSLQPHKEARFVFYAVPPLTAAAALGAAHLSDRARKSPAYRAAAAVVAASVLASFAASTAMLLLSSLNYPGGEALAYLRDAVINSADATAATSPSSNPAAVVTVHADVLSCMTGVTLFGAAAAASSSSFHRLRPDAADTTGVVDADPAADHGSSSSNGSGGVPALVLDKTEDEVLLRDPSFWTRFDYILAENRPRDGAAAQWEPVGVVHGYAGIEVLRPGSDAAGAASAAEEGATASAPVVGRGALVAALRERVRGLTGGWWVGPRMVPRVWIMRRVKGGEKGVGKGVVA